ncbi:MAG: 3'-5' exonuclease [Candidatus Peribacteria bacterium]|jgi:DNA polymerase-3 subunit alpha (Gram-positive type)|nr:3'-5' exonuclease [Candidatus Peribacteria bacterium]
MIVSFDLETTGLDKFNDKIIEIAMIKFDKQTFKIIETYSCFIDPEIPIPEVISNITSIFDDDVK